MIYFSVISDYRSFELLFDKVHYEVFENECDVFFEEGLTNYWIGSQHTGNGYHSYFVVDLTVHILIDKISLKNSHNGYRDNT